MQVDCKTSKSNMQAFKMAETNHSNNQEDVSEGNFSALYVIIEVSFPLLGRILSILYPPISKLFLLLPLFNLPPPPLPPLHAFRQGGK